MFGSGFGYERYDNADAVEPINELVGPYAPIAQLFSCELKLEKNRAPGWTAKEDLQERRPFGTGLGLRRSGAAQSKRICGSTKAASTLCPQVEVERRLKDIEKLRQQNKP